MDKFKGEGAVADNEKFSSLRGKVGWTQDFFGMLFGLSKNALSRIESGRREETLQQNEAIHLVKYIYEKEMLDDYVKWRFDLEVTKRFHK